VEAGAIGDPTDLAESELQDVLEGSMLGAGKCRSDDETILRSRAMRSGAIQRSSTISLSC
jgi:hypothetical protein